MFKKIVSLITVTSVLLATIGCTSTRRVELEQLKKHPEQKISSIVTDEGFVFEFEVKPEIDLENQQIVCFTKEGTAVIVKFENIKTVYVKRFDAAKTIVAVIGVSALVALVGLVVIALTKESCPFVYSFDGDQFVFDGEPYGGAICQALQREDLCKLDFLQPVNDQYRLLLTNEVNETQYTDEFKLLVVDHPADVVIVQSSSGELCSVDSLLAPYSVYDGDGLDWSGWLSKKDLLYWQSEVLSRQPADSMKLRDTLFFRFPKPTDATQCKLVVHGCNTIWGSQMLRRMAELAGDQVELWYQRHYLPEQKERRARWNDREEIFELQVYLFVNGQWEKRGEILGGGPFVAEERAIPLDLTGIEGDTLKVRIAPPVGFWKLNSFFVDYSTNVELKVQELSPKRAQGDDGSDLRALLQQSDGRYYAMPQMDQRAELVFSAPPPTKGLARTVFAKVSGYYDMHLNASGPPRLDIAQRLMTEPGYVTRFALDEYFKWRNETLAVARASSAKSGE